jgi:hypothetical protein
MSRVLPEIEGPMPRRHPAALPDHLPNSSTSGPSSPSLDPTPMSPKRDTSPMSMSKKKVTPVSTTAERGDAMLRAKTLRLTQEQRLAEVSARASSHQPCLSSNSL